MAVTSGAEHTSPKFGEHRCQRLPTYQQHAAGGSNTKGSGSGKSPKLEGKSLRPVVMRVEFVFTGPATSSSVSLRGAWNGWEALALRSEGVRWCTSTSVPVGVHEFYFEVDGSPMLSREYARNDTRTRNVRAVKLPRWPPKQPPVSDVKSSPRVRRAGTAKRNLHNTILDLIELRAGSSSNEWIVSAIQSQFDRLVSVVSFVLGTKTGHECEEIDQMELGKPSTRSPRTPRSPYKSGTRKTTDVELFGVSW
eukprot:CAMPEP_0185846104 /NCGR_PEP_ID=MMETSP1354-20130828/1854_1 /TAXON_ID=708628 /ORGANISM="Erythrolobus madagascarensis, Strain CCMP3276" /LENGTH=250 /DNA_ID=CAMNT_0028546189 /DNA_START=147 /DNA_END=896 /DNA_ORIENTATION=+